MIDAAAAGDGERTWPATPSERIVRNLDALAARLVGGESKALLALLQACYPEVRALERRAALVTPLVEALRREHFVMRQSNHRECATCALIDAASKEE